MRILFVFVFANIAVSIITVVIAQYFSQESTETRAIELVEQQLGSVGLRFEVEATEPLDRHLKLLVALPTMDEYLRASEVEKPIFLGGLFHQFSLITRESPRYRTVSYVDTDGNVRLHIEENRRRRWSLDLSEEGVKGPLLGGAAVAEEMRALFLEIKETPLLLSSGNMDYFAPPRPMQTSPVFKDADGRFILLAGTGKLDVDTGGFGGAVIIQYDLQSLLDSLSSLSIYDAEPLWVYDQAGQRLLAPELENLLSFDPAGFFDGESAREPGLMAVDQGIVGFIESAIAPGRDSLRFAIALPKNFYLSDIDPLFLFFAVAIAVSALIFAGIAIVASRYLSRPLIELAGTASRIADGELNTRVNVTAGGEIGVLVDSFNRMTRELRETIEARDETLVSLREQAKKQEELIRERVAAEVAGKAKSDFLAHMSHELRTPLNSILGFSDAMKQRIHGDLGHQKYQEYIEDISRSGVHLLDLINDILDLSKVEAGQIRLFEEHVDVGKLFHASVAMARKKDFRESAEILIELPDGFPLVQGDDRLLRQVLLNLLSNALKFTPPDGTVRLTAQLELGGGILIRVIDTGSGIPPADQARVMEPFQQVRREPRHTGEGTGLGLSLSRKFVELHGGRITLDSVVGEGTTVSVALPPTRTVIREQASIG